VGGAAEAFFQQLAWGAVTERLVQALVIVELEVGGDAAPGFGAGEKPLVLIARLRHNEALNSGRILYLKIGRSLLR